MSGELSYDLARVTSRFWAKVAAALPILGVMTSGGLLFGERMLAPTVTNLANTASILIPGRGTAVGTYITVPAGLGSLRELTVTVHGLSHPSIYKIYDMWVVGPRGGTVHLMQRVGSDNAVSNLTLSFNDAGVEFGSNPVISGTYRPTEGALTMFNGADPGGAWYLTANVAIATSDGTISNGWSMSLTTDSFPQTFTFTNEPVAANSTTIRLAHLTELRTAVNTLRQRHGLSAFSFTDPTTPTTVRGVHITELRSALGAVFSQMGRGAPTYSDPTITPQSTFIRAAHVNELRDAIREADQMPLTITKAGTGSGTVKSAPPGIACGNDCADAYAPGTVVTLTPTPASNSVFAGWSGACSGTGVCQLTMNSALAATATFNVAPITVTVTKSGTGTGTVTSYPAGIDCGASCQQAVSSGTAMTLYANPSAGSSFTGWSGPCSGTGTCGITVTASTQVTAAFAASTVQTYDAQPRYSHLGAWGGCNGAVIGRQFNVVAPAGTKWQVTWSGSALPTSETPGSLDRNEGTGSGTVTFTITIPAEVPGALQSCSRLREYYHTAHFTFTFYPASGGSISIRPDVHWTRLSIY